MNANIFAVPSVLQCLILTAVVFAGSQPTTSGWEVTEEWVAIYDGPGDVHDMASDMVIGSSGNVYVTGTGWGNGTGRDIVTVAYAPSGNRLWVARYNGPDNGHDYGIAIAVDSKENVYVTGASLGNGTDHDYVTIAYDSAGNELWVARYNGPLDGHDGPNAIALDSTGNVYVTGIGGVWGPGTSPDYVTVAYDPTGNELWVEKYNGPANGNDEARAIAVDSKGNVYVTGRSDGGGDNQNDYFTIAYDSYGNVIWFARYNSRTSRGDKANAIAVDSEGHVYVTGTSYGTDESTGDYATVAYDSSGNELWVARYNGPGCFNDFNDRAKDIVLDSEGHVYVTGSSASCPGPHYATVAYDSSGNELWVARYDYPSPGTMGNYAVDMTMDSDGKVYVAGESGGNGTCIDYVTVAYDSSGNELWVARYNGPGDCNDFATAIAVDAVGNVYVAGYAWNDKEDYDFAIVKYSQEWVPEAQVDIHPDTLNLRSKGRWITAHIELIGGGDVADIDVGTLLLNDTIPAERWPTAVGDYDEDGIPDLMVKFNRSRVQEYIEGLNLSPGGAGIFGYYVALTVTGSFNDGPTFECSDTIRVLVVERMDIETSPFSGAEYEGLMNGDLVAVQPQTSLPSSSHSSDHQVMVVSDIEYRESPTRRMNYILTMRE